MICHLFWCKVVISNDTSFTFLGNYIFIAAFVVHLICVSMIDSVCPWMYSPGGPIKNLVAFLCFLEPTECHVGQNCLVFYLVGVDCFGYV